MKRSRRQFLQTTAAAAVGHFALPAFAETYPLRPVHIVAGAPAGLAPDIVARVISQFLSERLDQQFVVDNRPGAGTNIATELVVRAPPDGYTLLLTNPSNAINATLYPNLTFNFIRDTVPVASIGLGPYVMVVNPTVPATTVAQFVAYAKANPGKINMPSAGNGTPPHIFGELFKLMAGIDLVHVPYRANFMPDLLAGQVQVAFNSLPAALDLVRSGKLRALGVTTAKRLDALPGVPSIAESVPGYEASSWYGLSAPKSTSPEIVDRLNQEINSVVADPGFATRFAALGNVPLALSPADFGAFIASETEKWGKVVKAAEITVG